MGKPSNEISGGIRGRVGALVYSSWKGIPVVKTRPERTKRRTPGEQLNQSKFAAAHKWLKPIISYLRVGFQGYSATVEGFNAAKSYTLKNAFTGEKENRTIDPALIKVSHGELPLPPDIMMARKDDITLEFTWDAGRYNDAHPDDQAMLLAYNPENKKVSMKLTGFFRHGGKAELLLNAGYTYHIYIAFAAHDRSRQSHSVYLGKVES
jgi:hypothetical protein